MAEFHEEAEASSSWRAARGGILEGERGLRLLRSYPRYLLVPSKTSDES